MYKPIVVTITASMVLTSDSEKPMGDNRLIEQNVLRMQMEQVCRDFCLKYNIGWDRLHLSVEDKS